MTKQYIEAQQLLDDAFRLGLAVLESGFRPHFIIGVWRGGTPVGIAVQELLEYFGVNTDHIAIRTSFYTAPGEHAAAVKVHGLGYVIEHIREADSLLIVDDVYDTGLSLKQVVDDILDACGDRPPEIRLATPYYKPDNNRTDRVPDYYLHETHHWLVFPHELAGMSARELLANKPGIGVLREKLASLEETSEA